MIINHSNALSFKGISIQQGGLEYIKNEGGDKALQRLVVAQTQFADTKWNLKINEDGYSLISPTTKKTYTGPFSVKKKLKTGAMKLKTHQLIVRMDKINRIKFPINFPNTTKLRDVYRAVKKSNGIEKMLLLLSILEKRI